MTLAWLSGSSDPERAALTPAERGLLEQVAQGHPIVDGNFPWPSVPGCYRAVPLPLASARNAAQYWRVQLSAGYRRAVAARVQHLIDHYPAPLLVITGSQGLELVRRAWPLLRTRGLRVASLGPVAGPLPDGLRPLVIRASNDLIARVGWRGPVADELGRGHLGYATDPAVVARLREWVAAA